MTLEMSEEEGNETADLDQEQHSDIATLARSRRHTRTRAAQGGFQKIAHEKFLPLAVTVVRQILITIFHPQTKKVTELLC